MAQTPRQPRRDRDDRSPLETSLSAAPTYRLGEPIEVTFSIRNSGATAYQILRWETPLEDEVTDFLIVEHDGRRLRYDGRHVKRGEPHDQDYEVVGPGETLSRKVDISRSYPVSAPGSYRATVNVTLFDAFPAPGMAKQAPRLRTQHQQLALPPASVQFTVVPDGKPKQTDGQAVREAAKAKQGGVQAKAKAKDPSFNGGTSAQQDDARIAHANAQLFCALAVQQLQGTAGASNTLYDDWFGTFDQGRYDTVTDHYADISKVLETETVTYDITGTGCQPSYFAYTYSGSRTVWLCNQYHNAPQIGTDCKFGTLVHEWSHAVSDTDDHVYGETGAGNLANTDPSQAIDNADNHEYFTEHLAQSGFGKALTFVTDRSQFGRDEVDALLASANPALIQNAFYVHADGFWPDKLGITAVSLGNSPNVKPTITLNPAISGMTVEVASLQAENPSLPVAPQRFTWVLRARFTSSNGFPNVPNGQTFVTLTATLAGLTASAQIRLVKEASPYELDGAVSWLSTDVRVFQIRAGDSRFGETMGSTPAAASTYVKDVVANLRSGNSGGQTFDSISTDQQASALELAQQVNGTKVFNFAVAKVRYVGTLGISNVRVFFRLFPASTTSMDFQPTTTYRRDTTGGKVVPLLGLSGAGDLLTIPCFAEARVDSASANLTSQTDPTNVLATMPASPPNAESVSYFGAWLDINQTQAQFPSHPSPANGPWGSGRKTVQELIKNAHQCLVAEIAYDADPVATGATPGGSDKLAQRNLAIVSSDNPGGPASHRIPNVFEFWPTPAVAAGAPDELLIDWGNVPAGTTASIYIPEIDAGQIVALTRGGARASGITQLDGQTISLPTGGIGYVPLPPGASFGLTGLLTLDLPDTVKKGEVYTVAVRQVTDAVGRFVPPPPPGVVVAKADNVAIAAAVSHVPLQRWRRIVGSYQITIPVRTASVMLPAETRLLSVLRWILQATATNDRWYPVFSRYVGLIADRVGALGGDPDQVHGSPTGEPHGTGHGDEEVPECPPVDRGPVCHFDGKVVGLIYDCFGDFEGFVLDDCGREFRFRAREHEIEKLAREAWYKRIAITVVARATDQRRPISIVLRHAPQLCCD